MIWPAKGLATDFTFVRFLSGVCPLVPCQIPLGSKCHPTGGAVVSLLPHVGAPVLRPVFGGLARDVALCASPGFGLAVLALLFRLWGWGGFGRQILAAAGWGSV